MRREGRHNIAKLVRKIGLTPGGFYKWVNGDVWHPNYETVIKCAEALNLTSEERNEFLKAAGYTETIPLASPLSPPPDEASPVVRQTSFL